MCAVRGGAGSDAWKASTTDNGDGTYAVQFQLLQAGPWTILPRCAALLTD